MTDLHDALDELLAAHDQIGSPLSRCAVAGREPTEVRSKLADLGLIAPNSVVEWFSWREFDRAAWNAAGARSSPELFWLGWPMTLDEAIAKWHHYEDHVDRFEDPANPTQDGEQWRSTWFPVMWSSPADIVVECNSGPNGPAPVRRVENQPTVPLGPAAPVIFSSLLELVQVAIRSVRDHYYWDGDTLQPRDGHDTVEIEKC